MSVSAALHQIARRVTGRVRSAFVVMVAVLAALLVTSTAASAATFNPTLTRYYTFGDCTISIGVVPDTQSPLGAIGGLTVDCSRRHAFVSGSVWLKFNGVPVAGSTASTNFLNAYGFGGRILQTRDFCGAGSWQVVGTVSLPEYGQAFVTNGVPQSWSTPCP